ncbi:hypothetical protein H8356DRAFT_1077523 [Neocallimastix lanati (nom. inval.)]|nr:hypothetical protein H8356DRAFT_1077523 [Neocallimastix sp. JGI-2020a]
MITIINWNLFSLITFSFLSGKLDQIEYVLNAIKQDVINIIYEQLKINLLRIFLANQKIKYSNENLVILIKFILKNFIINYDITGPFLYPVDSSGPFWPRRVAAIEKNFDYNNNNNNNNNDNNNNN